jgi:hypothetical protein
LVSAICVRCSLFVADFAALLAVICSAQFECLIEFLLMNRYKVLKQLGDGTYGSVFKAENLQTGEIVSILDKTLK